MCVQVLFNGQRLARTGRSIEVRSCVAWVVMRSIYRLANVFRNKDRPQPTWDEMRPAATPKKTLPGLNADELPQGRAIYAFPLVGTRQRLPAEAMGILHVMDVYQPARPHSGQDLGQPPMPEVVAVVAIYEEEVYRLSKLSEYGRQRLSHVTDVEAHTVSQAIFPQHLLSRGDVVWVQFKGVNLPQAVVLQRPRQMKRRPTLVGAEFDYDLRTKVVRHQVENAAFFLVIHGADARFVGIEARQGSKITRIEGVKLKNELPIKR